jgi:hypothetical protein
LSGSNACCPEIKSTGETVEVRLSPEQRVHYTHVNFRRLLVRHDDHLQMYEAFFHLAGLITPDSYETASNQLGDVFADSVFGKKPHFARYWGRLGPAMAT